MVKVMRLNKNAEGSDVFTKQGDYETEVVIVKIVKIFADLGDVPVCTIKMYTSEGEEIMNREFRVDDPGVYKPIDVIQEGSNYQHFYSAGPLTIEIVGTVSVERPINEIRIFYE